MQLYEGGQQYVGITTFCKTKLKRMRVLQRLTTLPAYYLLPFIVNNT